MAFNTKESVAVRDSFNVAVLSITSWEMGIKSIDFDPISLLPSLSPSDNGCMESVPRAMESGGRLHDYMESVPSSGLCHRESGSDGAPEAGAMPLELEHALGVGDESRDSEVSRQEPGMLVPEAETAMNRESEPRVSTKSRAFMESGKTIGEGRDLEMKPGAVGTELGVGSPHLDSGSLCLDSRIFVRTREQRAGDMDSSSDGWKRPGRSQKPEVVERIGMEC